MNKLTGYLSQPAPINDRPWLSVILTTVISFLILCIFQPFEFNLDNAGQIKVLLWFTSFFIINTTIVFVLFPKIFKRFYNPDTWTVGKTLLTFLFVIVLMGLCVTSLNYFVINKDFPERYISIFLMDMFASLTIGSIPACIIMFIIQNRELQHNLKEAKDLNKLLTERIKPNILEEGQIILSGSTKESITVKPEDIIYMEATGNYVNVHYKQDNKVTYKLLRITITQVEEALQQHVIFIRCHRAFIINTHKIYNVKGSAQGYKLKLYDSIDEIPVSRTYLKSLRDILR